jgi:hypothetical protein
MPRIDYNSDTRTLWVHWPEAKGEQLLHRAELQPFVDALIDGVDARGRAVKAVEVVFSDARAAAYNRDNLSFSRIGTWMDGDPPRRFSDGAPEPAFDVREDAGIPRKK